MNWAQRTPAPVEAQFVASSFGLIGGFHICGNCGRPTRVFGLALPHGATGGTREASVGDIPTLLLGVTAMDQLSAQKLLEYVRRWSWVDDNGLPDRLSNACEHCAYEITDYDLDQPGCAWFPLDDEDILENRVAWFEGELQVDALAWRHGDWMERLFDVFRDQSLLSNPPPLYCPWRDHLRHVQEKQLRSLLEMSDAPPPLLRHPLLDGASETLLSIVLEHYYPAGYSCRDMALHLINRGAIEQLTEAERDRVFSVASENGNDIWPEVVGRLYVEKEQRLLDNKTASVEGGRKHQRL